MSRFGPMTMGSKYLVYITPVLIYSKINEKYVFTSYKVLCNYMKFILSHRLVDILKIVLTLNWGVEGGGGVEALCIYLYFTGLFTIYNFATVFVYFVGEINMKVSSWQTLEKRYTKHLFLYHRIKKFLILWFLLNVSYFFFTWKSFVLRIFYVHSSNK